MATKPKVRGTPRADKAKPKARPKEKPQRERFIEAARAIGVDETGKEFERLFQRVAPPKRPP
jgi:hypothetical protein